MGFRQRTWEIKVIIPCPGTVEAAYRVLLLLGHLTMIPFPSYVSGDTGFEFTRLGPIFIPRMPKSIWRFYPSATFCPESLTLKAKSVIAQTGLGRISSSTG
jgi:hypothetical protein